MGIIPRAHTLCDNWNNESKNAILYIFLTKYQINILTKCIMEIGLIIQYDSILTYFLVLLSFKTDFSCFLLK